MTENKVCQFVCWRGGGSAPQRRVWRYKQGRETVKEFVLYPKSNGIS